MPSSRACIYDYYFPKKAFTPSHRVSFLLIFIGFKCEGLDFKAFTPAVKACEGLKEQSFTPENLWQSGEKAVLTPPEV